MAKVIQFQDKLAAAKAAGRLVKKETVGGITTETIEGKDGRRWLFAYRNKDHVVSSALSAAISI